MVAHEPDAAFTAYISVRVLWLRRIAYLLCRDWNQTDDLTQTAIAKFYARWPKLRSDTDNLDAYLRTTLVNTYISEQRSGWRRLTSLHSELGDKAASEIDQDTKIDLRDALAKLPPRQRAAIVLRYYCDLSVEQAARELGCSAGTVKSQTARALDAMRRALDGYPAMRGS